MNHNFTQTCATVETVGTTSLCTEWNWIGNSDVFQFTVAQAMLFGIIGFIIIIWLFKK